MKRLIAAGFTIVEVTVVVVVIGILATITVVSYNAVRTQAIESSMKSDLQNAAAKLEKGWARDGVYPANAAAANLTASDSNTIDYETRTGGYCVTVTNTQMGTRHFYKENAEGDILAGQC